MNTSSSWRSTINDISQDKYIHYAIISLFSRVRSMKS
jgi:hypothetical protein